MPHSTNSKTTLRGTSLSTLSLLLPAYTSSSDPQLCTEPSPHPDQTPHPHCYQQQHHHHHHHCCSATFRLHPLTRAALLAIVCASLTPTFCHAVPITHNLPAEAAVQMESILQYLPAPLQSAISSTTGFWPAFLQSLLLILACEVGDRTFFVAAILAMKASRLVVWCGALTALAGMTVLSAAIGKAFPLLLNKRWTSYAASALFLYFGIQLLRDWWRMRSEADSENEELAEVEEELRGGVSVAGTAEHLGDEKKSVLNASVGSGLRNGRRSTSTAAAGTGALFMMMVSPVFAKALSMTALAEWGDRSQIATIALGASRDVGGVIAGGVLGHAICTGLAVVGGRLLASSISEKAVALMGGVLFVAFALLTVTGWLD